jgi:thiamine biosynthesis lipoprotein
MSVTVIAPTCTMADAYASALCVMGPEQAKKSEGHWNRSGHIFSLFVIQSGDKVETIDFSGFKRWYDRPATSR